MAGGSDPPARPILVAEWRLRLTLPSGAVVAVACDSQEDAVRRGRRLGQDSVWQVEKRLVSPWAPVGPPLRTVVALVPVQAPHGQEGD